MSEPKPLSPSQRVARFTHRLGVVLATPFLIAAIWHGANAVVNLAEIPNPVAQADKKYPKEKGLFDDLIPRQQGDVDGPWKKYQNRDYPAEAKAKMGASLELMQILMAAALAIYAALRAIGWGIAGAFKT